MTSKPYQVSPHVATTCNLLANNRTLSLAKRATLARYRKPGKPISERQLARIVSIVEALHIPQQETTE